MRLDVRAESYVQRLHGTEHLGAVPPNDGGVENGAWFGDVRDVMADVDFPELFLGGEMRHVGGEEM